MPTLEIIPEEADCVRQIFRMYADGMGCTLIERAVNAQGFHGRRGSHFNRNTIRLILGNPVYIGKVRWDKTSRIKSGIGSERTTKVVYNPREKWKIVDGQHPAIIPVDLWDRVQDRLQSQYFYVDNKHAANPLASLVYCSVCNKKMNLQGKNKGVPYLLCATPGCCAGAKFEFVEQAVYRQLGELTREIELETQKSGKPDTSLLDAALDRARVQLRKLDERRNRLYSFLEDGTYTREIFGERMDALSGEETALREQIQSLEDEIRTTLAKDRRKQLKALQTVLDLYQHANIAEKKELLQSVVSKIVYTKHKKTKPADFQLQIILREFY